VSYRRSLLLSVLIASLSGQTLYGVPVEAPKVTAHSYQNSRLHYPSLNSTEIYNPTLHKWEIGTPMNISRTNQNSIPLNDGRILVVGGIDENGTLLKSAEIYDPATRQWTQTASLHYHRSDSAITKLNDGTVMIAGGSSMGVDSPGLRAVEIFNPATNSWNDAQPMIVARATFKLVTFKNGKVLAIGGASNDLNDSGIATYGTGAAEIYDPKLNTWKKVASMMLGRVFFSAQLLSDGKVWVGGGIAFDDTSTTSYAEVYDSVKDKWNIAQGFYNARNPAASILFKNPLSQPPENSFDDLVIVGGWGNLNCPEGVDNPGLNSIERFVISSDVNSSTVSSLSIAPQIGLPRVGPTPFVHNGENSALLIGGQVMNNCSTFSVTNEVLRLTIDSSNDAKWSIDSTLNQGRQNAIAEELPNGEIIVAGGSPK